MMFDAQSGTARLLLFTDNFEHGGSQAQLVQLANALERQPRFEVHVGCLHRRGPLLRSLAVPRERLSEYPLKRFYTASGAREIMRLAYYLISRQISLVHSQDFYANVMCAAASAFVPKTRLIVSRRYQKLTDRWLHRFGERWCYRLADAVIMNSESVARNLITKRAVAESKVVVIPNGLNLQRFALYPSLSAGRKLAQSEPCRVGIVGRLAEVKGHETLLQATARLVRLWQHLEVIIVGDGELRPKLEATIERLKLRRHVRLVGVHPDVRPWVATFDVAVLTSHREGLPNALLEYLAMGRPVVATRVGGILDVVRDRREALLVSPGDAEELACAIHMLLRDEQRRQAMGEAGRRRALDYQLERMTDSARRLYETILARESLVAGRWVKSSTNASGSTAG